MTKSMTHTTSRQRGFTLVELMLAMIFVSGLLLAIALLTMQVITIYTKGITLAAVDQAGQVIARELRDSTNSAIPTNIKVIQVVNGDESAGRYCTGSVSYIWNSGATINGTSSSVNNYSTGSASDKKNIRFVKVSDNGGALCANGNLTPDIDRSKATELLNAVDRNLAIRKLDILKKEFAAQAIYSFSLVVATNDAGQFISGEQNCQAPNDVANPDEFCATNSFDFTARAGNNLITGSSG